MPRKADCSECSVNEFDEVLLSVSSCLNQFYQNKTNTGSRPIFINLSFLRCSVLKHNSLC